MNNKKICVFLFLSVLLHIGILYLSSWIFDGYSKFNCLDDIDFSINAYSVQLPDHGISNNDDFLSRNIKPDYGRGRKSEAKNYKPAYKIKVTQHWENKGDSNPFLNSNFERAQGFEENAGKGKESSISGEDKSTEIQGQMENVKQPGQTYGNIEKKYINAEAQNKADIIGLIQSVISKSLIYPELARRMGMEGIVKVSFKIGEGGQPCEVKLERSSGYELLDRAAIEAVEKGRGYPIINKKVVVPVKFFLK